MRAGKNATAMKTSLLSLALLAATTLMIAALPAAPAEAETIYAWCMQPSGQWGPDCSFVTHAQCREAASAVGFCYQNPAYTVATQGRAQRLRR